MLKQAALRRGDRILDLSSPRIMGVLNITPDSFSDGGSLYRQGRADLPAVLKRALAMVEAGADILDIGGESTRPGASSVSEQEELDRVIPVIESLATRLPTPISVDTSTAAVMRAAVAAGASMINDVRALRRPGTLAAAAAAQVPVILMHMPAEPPVMQQTPRYDDVLETVCAFLAQHQRRALAAGITADLLLDPGFGFGKTLAHNLELLNGLDRICALGAPVVVGLSRKSMFGALTGRTVGERLPASLAAALFALQQGARIFRVHDVAATRDALRVWLAATDPAKVAA